MTGANALAVRQSHSIRPPSSWKELLSIGKAGNTAYLAAQFGLHSRLLGQVGNDDLAEQALTPLRRAGVDVSSVGRVDGRATGVSIVMVPPDAEKYIALATNANDDRDEPAAKSIVAAISEAARPACLAVDCEIPRRSYGAPWSVPGKTTFPSWMRPHTAACKKAAQHVFRLGEQWR